MFNYHVCGNTHAHLEFMSEVFKVDGKHVLVENIPAQVCDRCGEMIFSFDTTEKVRRLVHESGPAVRTVPLDVFELG